MNPSSRRQLFQEPQQVAAPKRNATCSWSKAAACYMDENRAAAAGGPGAVVVVDLDDQIVQVVLPHKTVTGLAGASPDRPVVPAVGRILAPGVARPDGPDRKGGSGPGDSVGPPPQPFKPEAAPRRSAVPLPLVGQNARTAQRCREKGAAGPQNAACFGSRSLSDVDMDERQGRHG